MRKKFHVRPRTDLQDRLDRIINECNTICNVIRNDGLVNPARTIDILAYKIGTLAEIVQKHFATGAL